MNPAPDVPLKFKPIGWRAGLLFGLIAVACFHIAYIPSYSGLLALPMVGYVIGLTQLSRLKSSRHSFYTGLGVGFVCVAPQLNCFWRIFGPGAIALWLVLALWIALFLLLTNLSLKRLGPIWTAMLIPFLWTGLEYFRSELYYLRFTWMNVGYAFSGLMTCPWTTVGIYGAGFIAAAAASFMFVIWRNRFRLTLIELLVIVAIVGIVLALLFPAIQAVRMRARPNLVLAGVQMEFPTTDQILRNLDKTITVPEREKSLRSLGFTNVNLVVLPEYTLDGEPPKELKAWCKANQKFLIVGGKAPAPGNNFYNSAFVISTNGEVVFTQGKSVPIQFFKDGLPATEQKLWDSPWGKIGICICYDLSYSHVTDELIRQGAQMIIVPTMDVVDWGLHQHELHARVAPVRAAEYDVPIFRVASSGISQGVDRRGRVQVTAPMPGEDETIFYGATMARDGGTVPLDRWLAPFCVAVTAAFIAWLGWGNVRGFFAKRRKVAQ